MICDWSLLKTDYIEHGCPEDWDYISYVGELLTHVLGRLHTLDISKYDKIILHGLGVALFIRAEMYVTVDILPIWSPVSCLLSKRWLIHMVKFPILTALWFDISYGMKMLPTASLVVNYPWDWSTTRNLSHTLLAYREECFYYRRRIPTVEMCMFCSERCG